MRDGIGRLTLCLLLTALLAWSVAPLAGAQQVTITWLYPGGEQPSSRETWEGQVARFHELHPDIRVEVIDVPWDPAHDRIVSMVLAGDAPDLIQMGSRWIPEFVEMGALLPLDGHFSPERLGMYYPGLLQTVTYKGSVYALPQAYSTQALIYRTDLIDTPPATWEELVATAKRVQADNPDMFGFGISGADHVSTLSQFFTILFAYGGSVFDAEGNVTLNSAAAEQALEFYVNLHREHKVVPNPIEYHREELPSLFAGERIAMFVSGPWGGVMTGVDPDNDRIPYAAALAPAGPAGPATELVSDSTGVWADSSNKEAALKLLDFITTEEEQVFRDLVSGTVPQGPEMAALPEFAGDPYFQTFIDMAEYGAPQPQPYLWEPFQDVIVEMVQSALLGRSTPKQAIERAVQRLHREGLVPAEL